MFRLLIVMAMTIFMLCYTGEDLRTNATTIDIRTAQDFLFGGLSDLQKNLFRSLILRHGAGARFASPDLKQFWESLSYSQATTFAAITHALEHTKLKNGRPALSLVQSIETVDGDVPGAKPYMQHDLTVHWMPGAPKLFREVGFSRRPGWGHSNEWGLTPEARSYGLHVLFHEGDPTRGHVHIDYRNFGLIVMLGVFEGHFSLMDADVRAIGPEKDFYGQPINNYKRHVNWYGPIPGFIQ